MSTRDIARAAVRAELAHVAFELFCRHGFDKVTVDDLAAAGGVSRSTFLRYFGSKEDAVLGAFDSQGARLADALRARPAGESDWTALRRALDSLVEPYLQDPDGALAVARLVKDTRALCSRQLEQQHGWRAMLTEALAERAGATAVTVGQQVRAAAALDCLNVAVDEWAASEGQVGLVAVLDEAFGALGPRPRRRPEHNGSQRRPGKRREGTPQ